MTPPATPSPTSPTPARTAAPDAIAVRDVFCLYPVPDGSTVAALRGLSLRVPAGERLVVHGPNGSGKTTLLRVLTGEVRAGAGSVAVGGLDLSGARGAELATLRRDVLGVVDQHSGRTLRPELSAADNVALQLRIAGRRRGPARAESEKTLAELGLLALAGRRPATLSAGEAQRVAVCAAVAHRPAVLLADEPTGTLDVEAADSVYDLLDAAARQAGATLVLVTHDPRAARIADRVVRIRDGRLSEQWRPGEPAGEELVVDDRGWLRLPESVRRQAGVAGMARVRFDTQRDRVELAGTAGVGARPEPTPIVPGPLHVPSDTPIGALSEVRVAYGPRVVLDGFSATFAPSTLTVLRGRSGAGKTTVLQLLLGLADPDAGDVRLGGRQVRGLTRTQRADLRRELVGVSLAAGALAESLDVLENLAFARATRGLPADGDLVRSIADALGVLGLAGRPVRLLSGGERQRVAAARALVAQRPLVVLDEPTAQQDEAHAALVAAVLAAAAGAGTAVVCATHDETLAAAADVVLELR
ncbi:ATP-binding cassette domain-containing protein [uncultured Jatrophihabitans sp.]|uniref:ATP-binding cassette domain-containing protein n=1 Tax=uncultured Jatrophihabitans sp. TaxID=1610747 RepID=UPI0035CAA5A1